MRKHHNVHFHLRLSAVAAACTVSALAQAQTTPAAEQNRIVITGSNIRSVDAESALPVLVLTAEDIARSGKATITEILRGLAIGGANGVTDSQSFSNFAYGASGISLRGLGATSTLILINGRRVAPYSVPDINRGLTNFVNVDAIPRAAIARIEVLKDGASAIYGSDAMAGVVNIILRSDYQGGTLEVSASANQHREFGTQWGGLTVGRGSLADDGWNWLASFEAYHREGVMLRDVKDQVVDARARDSTFYYTGRPYTSRYSPAPNYFSGVSVDPALGTSFVNVRTAQPSPNCPAGSGWAFNDLRTPPTRLCGYDFWNQASQYRSPIDRQSVYTRGELNTGGVTLFAELALTNLVNRQRDQPVPFGAGLGATPNGRDGGTSYVPQFLPAGHPNNPFPRQDAGITYMFQDVGYQGINVRNNASRVLLGARGDFKGWDWEVGLLDARDRARITYVNRVSLPALRDAVLAGTYNFENPAAGRVTADQLRIAPVDHGLSSFTALDAKVSGTLGALPGGPIGFASGLELRHESRRYTPDDRIYGGEVYLQVAGRTSGSRDVSSGFAELSLPFTKAIDSQLALRFDHYSDFGSAVTPKFALSWKPADIVKLRGSVAKGFRAPSLNEAASSDTPLFNFVNFDPKRCGNFNVDCDGYNNSGVAKANPAIKPERSTSYGMGVVLQPLRNTTVALDFWQFDRRNEIVILGQQDVIDNEDSTDPLYAGRVRRLPADTVSLPSQSIPGRITTVETQYVNRGRTVVRGVDLDIGARLPLEAAGGAVGVRSSFSYLDRFRTRTSDSSPWLDNAGALGYPRVRGGLTLDWTTQALNVGATTNFVASYRSNQADQTCSGGRYVEVCKVSRDLTLDLFASYQLTSAFKLRGSVRNVADKRMPYSPTRPLGDTYWYSPEGRYFSVSASYQF